MPVWAQSNDSTRHRHRLDIDKIRGTQKYHCRYKTKFVMHGTMNMVSPSYKIRKEVHTNANEGARWRQG